MGYFSLHMFLVFHGAQYPVVFGTREDGLLSVLTEEDLDIISCHVNVIISVAKPVIVDLDSMNYNMVQCYLALQCFG